MTNNSNGKNWAFILYPDSAPDNWLKILKQSFLPICISPLHDKDVFDDGTVKKAHYHIILEYPNTTTYNNILSFVKMVNGSNPIKLLSLNGYYQYLDHDEEEDKVKYNRSDEIQLNEFKLDLNDDTKTEYSISIIRYIQDNNIYEFADLMDKLPTYDIDLFNFFIKTNAVWDRYVTSRRNKGQIKK